MDTEAVCRNYDHYAAWGRVIPVLKNDGYGMGAGTLLSLLRNKRDVRTFACSRTEEALALAEKGADIMLMGCEHEEDLLRRLARAHVIIAIESLDQADALQNNGVPVRVQLKVDTGLARFGFSPDRIADMKAVFDRDRLTVCGVFSHLADSGKEAQLECFQRVLSSLEGYPVGLRHIASTHSAEEPQYRLDAMRIGSGLTGLVAGLEPAASLTARICTLRRMKKGDAVGYGGVRLKRDSLIAIIDAGTGDGAFVYRTCGPRTWLTARKQTVRIGGTSAPVLGFAGLTHTAIDVTGIPCGIGDRVTIPQSPVMVPAGVHRKYF